MRSGYKYPARVPKQADRWKGRVRQYFHRLPTGITVLPGTNNISCVRGDRSAEGMRARAPAIVVQVLVFLACCCKAFVLHYHIGILL